MGVNLSDLREGDLVKLSRTARYERQIYQAASSYRFYDVQSGHILFENSTDFGEANTLEVTLLERAKREYKVGDELTGDEVDAGNFRRGTAIVDCQYPNSVYVKDDRYWIAPAIQMRVSHFGGVTIGKYRIINLP